MREMKFVQNVGWMTLGFSFRFFIQIAYFLFLTRTLKPEEFGSFSGCLALVTLFAPFASWGSGSIMIKHVSSRPELFQTYWGIAFFTSILSGFLLCGGVVLIATAIFPLPFAYKLVLPIAIGELLGSRLSDVSGQAFQAFQKLSRTSFIWIMLSFFRFGAVMIFVIIPLSKTAGNWVLLFMCSGLLAGVLGILLVFYELGWGPLGIFPVRKEWLEGFYFAVSHSVQGVYVDIDKALLLKMSSRVVTGVYTAAYRILDAAFIPVRAILYSAYPRFFQEGNKSIFDATKFAIKLLPWAVILGLLGMGGVILFAPFVPLLLGEQYKEASKMLIVLSPILLFRSFHYLAADTLTGSGFQNIRTMVQVGIAILNFCLNIFWIPRLGWLGAALSSLVSDGALALFLWIIVVFLLKKAKSNVY